MEKQDLTGKMEKILKELSLQQQKRLLEQAHTLLQTDSSIAQEQTCENTVEDANCPR